MTARHALTHALRQPIAWLFAAAVAFALLSGQASTYGSHRASIPFPSLIYRIEATSGSHTATILNLPIGYVGALQAPVPVDVDGNLIPDVEVSVNLLDTQGIHNPPQVGDIIRPNIEINRYPLDLANVLLGQPSPPLRIDVALDINDLQGEQPKMTARFGYDTAGGGSIPAYFQATVDGLENFFNPVTATISTKGAVITQSTSPLWYRGPLTVIGGFQQGSFNADLGLKYSPFPDQAAVTYSHDAAGNHIDYSHDYTGDVDLLTNATITDGPSRTNVSALVQHLPRKIGVDLLNEADGGGIRYDSTADGRLPDVDVTYRGPLQGDVYNAHLNIEQLPNFMEAHWKMPSAGPVSASFDSSGQGIGAIEANIANKDGNPQGLPPFVFNEKQALAVQSNTATGGLRLGGRIERIRHLDVAQKAGGGLVGTVNVGDGELPLQLHAFLDLRSTGAPLLDADATLSPLPSGPQPGHPTFELTPAGSDQQADPLTFAYSSLESVDIDGHVLVRDPNAPATSAPTDPATCGTTGVLCGDLRIRNIPTSLVTKIGEFKSAANGKREMRVDVDADGPGHTDIFGDVKVGPDIVPNGTPISGRPLSAHVELLGIAKHARVRTVEGQDDTLQRAEFHTCDFNYTTELCSDATKDDQIGALQFTLANFLAEHRNDPDVNVPSAYATTPNYATITARGHDNGNSVAFEATGRVQSIRELTYINDGAFGVRTNVGDNKPLNALVDIKDIALNGANGQHRPNHSYDVNANVLIKPLPQKMSFCFNESGQEIVSPTSTITAPCQDKNPFSTDANRPSLAKSPMSLSYDGKDGNDNPQQIDEILVNGMVVDKGATPIDVSDDRTIKGHVDITNIPATVRAHFLDPKAQGGGPMRLLVEAPVQGPQLKVEASAAMLDADLQCQDPRVPAPGQSALCAGATLNNLPTRVTMDYDPTVKHDNFVLDTAGDKQMDITGLSVSSVQRDDATGLASVLVGEGQILGLPKTVKGTLVTPAPDQPDDPVNIDLTATPALGSIDATVRNFIAPDPIPDMAAQRDGLPQPDDYASFIQRGDAFKGVVHITSVSRVGFANQVDANGKKLDTNVVDVDFGKDKVIRGFVDLDPDGTNQILGDVTLTDVPAGIQLCFRGPKLSANADALAANPTFCDQQPRAAGDNTDPTTSAGNADTKALQQKVGAFEARMTPVDGPKKLDVHAFVRSAKGGGADVLAGKVDVIDIPNVIRGTFGDGKVDVGGYTLGGVADGIAQIGAHIASFDITDDGWNATTRPYAPRFVFRSPFPAPSSTNEFASLRADDTDFEARAQIGPQSQLHRVQVSDSACAKPVAVDYDGDGQPDADYGARPDFPFFPTDDGSKYTCIRGDFKPAGNSTVDPLDLSVVVQKAGKLLSLDQGRLDDIPEFFQVNLADANPVDTADQVPDHQLRPTCVGGPANVQPTHCVAPLVRFDNPGNSTLSGAVEYGAPADLAELVTVQPREDQPDDLAAPTSWGEDGIRARVGSFTDSTAARAAFHLPIPASVTVDQVGTWSMQDLSSKANYRDASDLHFRFAARHDDGSTFDNLGRLSAFIHSFSDGSQVLLSSEDPKVGFHIPGELGIDLYTRNHDGNGRNFIQIDGRSSSHDLSIRARMLGTGGSPVGRLDAQIRNVPPMQSLAYARDDDPSFRIRAEVMGDGKEPPDSSGSDPSSSSAPPKEDDCSPLLCVVTQVRLQSVNVQFDFKPGNAPDYARLLEAAIHTDGAKNGVQIRGNSKIDGSGDPARFLAGAQVVVDPINVFVHAGIPLLASFDLVNLASLDAAFSIGGTFANQLWDPGGYLSSGSNVPTLSGDGTTDFALRQNLVHITANSGGPGDSFIGPIDYNVTVLHGEAWALFVKLIGVDFVPEPGTLRMPYFDCQNPGAGIIESALGTFIVPGGGSASVVAWPFGTPPIVYSGLLGGPATLFGALAEPFFCLASTDQTLISDSPTDPHPSDPLGVAQTGSVVPDAKVSAVDVTTPPTPPTNPQLADYTAKSTVPLCGTFTFRNISVPSGVTLHVADTSSSVDINGNPDDPTDNIPAACSASSTQRELTLIASGGVTVTGTIDAHALVHTTSATGNSGGGHGAGFWPLFGSGSGGDGGNSGTGGHYNGDLFDSLTSEVGEGGSAVSSPAGSGAAGAGGGLVKIIADTLTVSGTITADGDAGQSVATGHCSVADDPNTTDVDETQPNTGKAGGGGGAGGGIVINVADFENSGSVHANGGAGGDGKVGAGGGGGGGNVKLSTALFGGSFPTASGGSAGANGCPSDFGAAGAGQTGNFQFSQAPKSRVDVSGLSGFGFWHSTQGDKTLTLPYSAASASNTNDMTVILCATVKPPDLPQPTDTSITNVLLPAVPSSVDIDHPCGTEPVSTDPSHIVSQPTYIDRHYLQNTNRVDPPSATFDLTDLAEGYYGFYTVVWRSSDNNNDCFDWIDLINSGDLFGGFGERLHDQGVCSEPEEMPSSPDVVVGIDNTNPNMRALTVHGTKVRNDDGTPVLDVQPVPTNTRDEQVVWNDDDNLSGVLGRDCSGDVTVIHAPPAPDIVTPDANHPFRTCVSGQTVEVTNGDGTKTLAVRLTDSAGNEDTFHVDVMLDTTKPDSSGAALTTPNRLNGWYSTSPHFLLDGFDDHGGSGAADPAYQFQFDEGDQKGCLDAPAPADPTCTIDGSPGHELPGLGRHTLHWSAVDKVGNQYTGDARPNLAVKIDGQAPTSALLSVPAVPNGANGWYSGPTWVTFGAFDQPGGSGFTQAADDTPNGKVSGVVFTVSHNGGPAIAHGFDPQHPVPFRLDPGQSHVCWQGEDQAGNIEAADPITHCRDFMVDERDPSAALSPGGSTTWSTSAVPVMVQVSDAGADGSGVAADANASTLCTPVPTIAASAPSGTCISIDGSPFVTTIHDKDVWSLGEGLHEVRTFATDRAGRRSAIRTELYKVDLSNPVAVARVIPAQPASGKWWRATPTVVLRAADGDRHGSGVASIQYKINGSTSTATYTGPCSAGACTYTGPFTLPEGLYRVTYWATDNAGRKQPDQVLHVAVDTTPPVAVATSPNPAIWLRSSLGLPLTYPTVALRWTLQENLSGRADVDNSPVDKVRVQVVVYDVMGFPVRTLDAGTIAVAPGQTYQGSTAWDGKGSNLTSLLPVGTYYYRVVATDAAGNQTMSGESQKLLIALKLLL